MYILWFADLLSAKWKMLQVVQSAMIFLHTETHTKTLKCEDCNKFYRTKGSLYGHKKSMHQPKSVECVECGKLFTAKAHLHQIVVNNEEPMRQWDDCHLLVVFVTKGSQSKVGIQSTYVHILRKKNIYRAHSATNPSLKRVARQFSAAVSAYGRFSAAHLTSVNEISPQSILLFGLFVCFIR